MERHALTFRIRPGSEPDVAKLLAGYRAPSLRIDDETRLVGTAVFMKDDLVVRAVEVDGDISKVAPHLARDEVIQEVERALVPHLTEPYDPADPAQRGKFFAQRMMERVVHRESPDAAGITQAKPSRHALLYPIRPGREAAAAQVLTRAEDPPLRQGGTMLLNTSVFVKGDVIVRVFGIDGSVDDLIDGLSEAIEVHNVGGRLAALFAGAYDFTTRTGLRAFFTDNLMTTITDRTADASAPEGVPAR
jgi:hypothetical protein